MACPTHHSNLGKYCLRCDLAEYAVIGIGAGMTSDMIKDFGERVLGLKCQYIKGKTLEIFLTNNQVAQLSKGKLKQISEELVKTVELKDVKQFVSANFDEINVKQLDTLPPCLYDIDW